MFYGEFSILNKSSTFDIAILCSAVSSTLGHFFVVMYFSEASGFIIIS